MSGNKQQNKATSKKQTKLGLDIKKNENYSEWYSQVKIFH
jgi:hypothetical protein